MENVAKYLPLFALLRLEHGSVFEAIISCTPRESTDAEDVADTMLHDLIKFHGVPEDYADPDEFADVIDALQDQIFEEYTKSKNRHREHLVDKKVKVVSGGYERDWKIKVETPGPLSEPPHSYSLTDMSIGRANREIIEDDLGFKVDGNKIVVDDMFRLGEALAIADQIREYPALDEGLWSQKEMELISDAYDDYLRSDYLRDVCSERWIAEEVEKYLEENPEIEEGRNGIFREVSFACQRCGELYAGGASVDPLVDAIREMIDAEDLRDLRDVLSAYLDDETIDLVYEITPYDVWEIDFLVARADDSRREAFQYVVEAIGMENRNEALNDLIDAAESDSDLFPRFTIRARFEALR